MKDQLLPQAYGANSSFCFPEGCSNNITINSNNNNNDNDTNMTTTNNNHNNIVRAHASVRWARPILGFMLSATCGVVQ